MGYWLWFLLIGLVAGWLASLIVKGSGSGFFVNILIGVVGSLLGGWLFGLLGLVSIGIWGHLLSALVGAIVLLLIAGLFQCRKKQ